MKAIETRCDKAERSARIEDGIAHHPSRRLNALSTAAADLWAGWAHRARFLMCLYFSPLFSLFLCLHISELRF